MNRYLGAGPAKTRTPAGEAATYEEAVAVVFEMGPDVVSPDPEMPGGAMEADEPMGEAPRYDNLRPRVLRKVSV